MPKYKYVDGVKYRVVPQSVLGYALVREGSDNSLPSGGTEGQVLAKASDADYDVEWSTVESGGGDGYSFVAVNNSGTITSEVDIDELVSACEEHKDVRAIIEEYNDASVYGVLYLKQYYSSEEITQLEFSMTSGDNAGIAYNNLTVTITNGEAEFTYETGYHSI